MTSIEMLTATFWALHALLGAPDMGAVQPTPQHQELAATADKLRDHAQWHRWDELPLETRVAIELVWGERR